MCMNAQMNDWSDIHFAYQVAHHGTLSAAAQALNVHHSTVLRRIDALEKRLNTRLFHRHARGYRTTAAGEMLLKTARQTQEDFDQLLGQLEGADEQLTGTLVITTVSGLLPLVSPFIAEFQLHNPEIHIDLVVDSRIFKLEHGEAHVSLRPGAQPKDSDYVVQLLETMPGGLYASSSYIKRVGRMKNINDIAGHRFIGSTHSLSNIPAFKWLEENVPPQQIYFRASDMLGLHYAVQQGMGIAPVNDSGSLIASKNTAQLLFEPPEEWSTKLWLVTHRDMHRTAKVQAFTQFIKGKFSA